MAPPKLAADAPVLDVVHPLVVGVDPVLRHEAHGAGLHRVDRLLRDRFAGGIAGADLVHRDKPLVGQHRLDDLAGAGAARHHQLVLLDLDQQAQRVQVFDDLPARVKAVHALVHRRSLFVDRGVQRQHADDGQLMALADRIVVGVMRRRDLDHPGAKGAVHVVVGNHRNQTVAQRQVHVLADQVGVAFVFRVDHHRHVAEHGFGTRGGHGQAGQFADGAMLERVQDVPQRAVFFLALDFQVGHGRLQHRVPVHQALATVDQALFVQAHKGFGDDFGELVVHREVFAAPVHAVAHAAHLRGDGVARLLLPLPDLSDKVLARLGRRRPHGVAAQALGLELAFDDDLRGDAGMVGARNPGRVAALHAVVARQAVHDGLVERVAHVQRAGDVGRRQLDRERRRVGLGRLAAAVAGLAVATLFPDRAPLGFDGRGFKGFGQAVEAGLVQRFGHGERSVARPERAGVGKPWGTGDFTGERNPQR